jgi:hypothetical protein
VNVRNLNPRDQRALRWGAFILVPALSYVFAGKPYVRALVEAKEEWHSEQQLLDREQALLNQIPAFDSYLAEANEAFRAEVPRLFLAEDLVVLTAEMGRYVEEAARQSEVLVQQREVADTQSLDGGVLAIRIELRAIGDLEGILGLLHRLETGPKRIHVESLVLDRSEWQGLSGTDTAGVLTFSATLRGYSLSSESLETLSDRALAFRSLHSK